jgi:hypothetical protein
VWEELNATFALTWGVNLVQQFPGRLARARDLRSLRN